MGKKMIGIILTACLIVAMMPVMAFAGTETTSEAVFLGIDGYGQVGRDEVLNADFAGYRFFVDGQEQSFKVKATDNFDIQNVLQEGYIYDITVADKVVTKAVMKDKGVAGVVMGTATGVTAKDLTVNGKKLNIAADTKVYSITTAAGGAKVAAATVKEGDSVKVMVNGSDAKSIYVTFVAKEYKPPVQGTPGVKTLKNFLKTAMGPLGTALYIYGGSWDWEDDESSPQSTTIGVPQSWIDFFQEKNSIEYNYGEELEDFAHSYYPNGEWNQYYYAGVDCSAFVGWTIYNTINTKDGQEGYVGGSTKFANRLEGYGWGTKSRDEITKGSDLKVGDVFSMSGHVWIVVGVCDDDSVVIVHSTASVNRNDVHGGGGAQLSAMNPKNPTDKNCDAYRMATYYMSTLYGDWYKNYNVMLRNFDSYTAIASGSASKDLAGKFTWDLSGKGLLTDPDGYANMGAEAILADLFQGACAPYSKEKVEPFADSRVSDWFNDDVNYVYGKGIMNGTTATTFAPNASITRGQIVTMLYRMAGSPAVTAAAGYTDVAADQYYANAVAWAAENKIVSGYADGTFKPNAAITREQMASMLYNFAKLQGKDVSKAANINAFADASAVSAYAVDAMKWACGEGLISGSNNQLAAKNSASRAQAAAILHRFAEL